MMRSRDVRRSAVLSIAVALACLIGCDGSSPDPPVPVPFDGPLSAPTDWSGTWQLTITFRDCASHEVLAIEEYEELLCPGEVLGSGIAPLLDDCEGEVVGDSLTAHCALAFSTSTCDVSLTFDLDAVRDGDTLTGTGHWGGEFTGTCEDFPFQPCQTVEITGTRIDADASGCSP
jgi:hypothetical protein